MTQTHLKVMQLIKSSTHISPGLSLIIKR